jgi:hypothetical protein
MADAKMTRPWSGMVGVEEAWGCDTYLISIARQTGINAVDLEALREFCMTERLLMIFRSPQGVGRQIVGIGGIPILPKPAHIHDKTGGKWIKRGDTFFVSDYDVLSVWRRTGHGYAKVPLPPSDARTDAFIKRVSGNLVMPLQHGANDDYLECDGRPKNPAIGEHFCIIPDHGLVSVCASQKAMRSYYAANKLKPWLYGDH